MSIIDELILCLQNYVDADNFAEGNGGGVGGCEQANAERLLEKIKKEKQPFHWYQSGDDVFSCYLPFKLEAIVGMEGNRWRWDIESDIKEVVVIYGDVRETKEEAMLSAEEYIKKSVDLFQSGLMTKESFNECRFR